MQTATIPKPTNSPRERTRAKIQVGNHSEQQSKLVYIGGSGHSGSTLLDLLLGGHSMISALGEVHRIYLCANRQAKVHWCYCGKHVLQCPMWLSVAEQLQQLLRRGDPQILKRHVTTDPAYLKLEEADEYNLMEEEPVTYSFSLNKMLLAAGSSALWKAGALISSDVRFRQRVIQNSLLLYEAVRRACNTPIVVDATKDPSRLKGLYLASPDCFRLLYLTRDGRAVCRSRMKRQQMTMEDCAKIWLAEQRKQWLARLTIPNRQIIWARYEDICTSPIDQLTRICRELDLTYEPDMLDFRQRNRHNIGGNPMRFRQHEQSIRIDERWRRELSREDLATFNRIAGRMNEYLGYAT